MITYNVLAKALAYTQVCVVTQSIYRGGVDKASFLLKILGARLITAVMPPLLPPIHQDKVMLHNVVHAHFSYVLMLVELDKQTCI